MHLYMYTQKSLFQVSSENWPKLFQTYFIFIIVLFFRKKQKLDKKGTKSPSYNVYKTNLKIYLPKEKTTCIQILLALKTT